MRPEGIIKHLRQRPFRPIRIALVDGSYHDVRHGEMVLVTRRTVAIALNP